jgi:predicted enzyme related to lactoylglutathione lyase
MAPFLIEFPADDPARARRFWEALLGASLRERTVAEGSGWQAGVEGVVLGLHPRGAGPGDRFALPYLPVADLEAAVERVTANGGEVIHAGAEHVICRDSEGTPFGLSRGS